MLKRFLPLLALILLPTGVWADDVAPADMPTSTPAAQTGSSSLQPSNPAVGGSSADSSALQPAGGTGLGASNSDSAGLTAPTGNSLQGTTNASDQIKTFMNGEADGAPQQPAAEATDDLWPAGLLLALLALGGVIIWQVRRRQLARAHARFAQSDAD